VPTVVGELVELPVELLKPTQKIPPVVRFPRLVTSMRNE
jgi:hypothetical protein